jgi:hypothetical protein
MIYNLMMGRDLNFRYTDLSSVFNSPNKIKYFKRLFAKGDEVIPDIIKKDIPILQIATHCLSAFAQPLLDCFNDKMLLINMHRNPLYMLKQNLWNVENLIGNQRDFAFYYKWNNRSFPFFFYGQEEKMLNANPKEKSIYFIEWLRKAYLRSNVNLENKKYYELTFESLVLDPFPHLERICELLSTEKSSLTSLVLKKEKIPRILLTHGKDLPIYRRVNWQKTDSISNEEETNRLYSWAKEGISNEAKTSLDWLIEDYNLIKERLK